MTFEEALQALKDGKKVRRHGWVYAWVIKDNELSWTLNYHQLGNVDVTPKHIPSVNEMNLERLDDFIATDWEIVE